MPTYEYMCEKCGHQFEEFQRITAEPLKKCVNEGCGGTVKRLFSRGGGFIFKGSGFYATDYRSDSYGKGAKSDSAASPTSSKTEKKTDSSTPGSGLASPSSSTGSGSSSPSSKNDSGSKT